MFEFDPTISLGNALAVVGFLVGGLAAFLGMQNQVRALQADVLDMKGDLHKLTDIIVAEARHETRIDDLERRVSALERRNERSDAVLARRLGVIGSSASKEG